MCCAGTEYFMICGTTQSSQIGSMTFALSQSQHRVRDIIRRKSCAPIVSVELRAAKLGANTQAKCTECRNCGAFERTYYEYERAE